MIRLNNDFQTIERINVGENTIKDIELEKKRKLFQLLESIKNK